MNRAGIENYVQLIDGESVQNFINICILIILGVIFIILPLISIFRLVYYLYNHNIRVCNCNMRKCCCWDVQILFHDRHNNFEYDL